MPQFVLRSHCPSVARLATTWRSLLLRLGGRRVGAGGWCRSADDVDEGSREFELTLNRARPMSQRMVKTSRMTPTPL